MKIVSIRIHVCGMSDKNFTKYIMIYKPYKTMKHTFLLKGDKCKSMRISDLLVEFTKSKAYKHFECKYSSTSKLRWQDVYIQKKGNLFGLQEDKCLDDIFAFFSISKLTIDYFFVAGGASMSCNGYRYVVHPDEDIHRNTPHVHVERDDMSVRYHLDTLERFTSDKCGREFKRDEKKIIIPTLKKYNEKLWEYWNIYINGYIPPVIDENGNQFYKES